MTPYRQIRADFDRETIVVYQAYNDAIADAAVAAQKFVPPFSFGRMTWIKPSFLWLMERSGWGTKSNQERTLAVRISRAGWDQALQAGVLTSFDPAAHRSIDEWRSDFSRATVHVQWDPERSIYGKKLEHRSIQVGLSRQIAPSYASEWIKEIKDLTPLVAKIARLCKVGKFDEAKRLLPKERVYPVDAETMRRLGTTE
jgi:Domain of unknown function (DUF4291)